MKMLPMPTKQTSFPGIGPAVTDQDVATWLRIIARIEPGSPRAAAYVRGYQVARKVQRAKAAGDWPPIAVFIGQ
jgi:hypothetical protein